MDITFELAWSKSDAEFFFPLHDKINTGLDWVSYLPPIKVELDDPKITATVGAMLCLFLSKNSRNFP